MSSGMASSPTRSVRDLIGRCADLEAALLLSEESLVKELPTSRTSSLKSPVEARLLLAA